MSQKWCTIESDPGVFTELVKKIGVKGVQVDELITLEDEELNAIKPIYGLIFLFKWVADPEKRQTLEHYDPNLFFANQVINNACATQAILSILMNQSDKIDIGQELNQIKSFTTGMNSKDKGLTIGNSDTIREVHNSFARQDPFTIEDDDRTGGKEEDVFHFIGYVPNNGQLYELDGLQAGPISFGACTDENWLALAREQIQQRIQKYAQSEIRFNLLVITSDKKEQAETKLKSISLKRQFLQNKIDGSSNAEIESQVDQSFVQEVKDFDSTQLKSQLDNLEFENSELVRSIEQESEKQARWKTENERRRHNYVPLIFELLQQLGKKNLLGDLFKDAVEKKKEKDKQEKEKENGAKK